MVRGKGGDEFVDPRKMLERILSGIFRVQEKAPFVGTFSRTTD
jgi:hypothetical protein